MTPRKRALRAHPACFLGLVAVLAAVGTPAPAQPTSPHLIYGTDDAPDDTPRIRGWNDHPDRRGWSSEVLTTSATAGANWVVSARSPFGNEALAATLTTTPNIDVLRWDGNAWTVDWSTASTGPAAHRGVAVAYMQGSGQALVVHADGSANPRFRVWDGTSWTADAPVFDQGVPAAPGTGSIDWIELASDPTSDQIALVYSDANNDVHAVIWDGTDWDEANTEITLTADGSVFRDFRDVQAAYDSGGNLMVVVARDQGFDYFTMTAGTTTWVAGGFVRMFNGNAAFIDLAVEPGGDRMAVAVVDQDMVNERLAGSVWSGASWATSSWAPVFPNAELEVGFPHWETTPDGPFWASVAWLGQTGTAVIVASELEDPPPPAPGDLHIAWYTWTAGAGWTAQSDLAVPGISAANPIRSLQAESFPSQNTLMVAFSDASGNLRTGRYDGTSWTFSDVLNASLPSALYKPFSLLAPATPDNFGFLKPIAINRARIPGGCGTPSLADFPLLYSVTDPDLAHTTSGGDVTDPGGDDIVFKGMDDATCGGPGTAPCQLDHEIESYDPATGELVAWVRVPSVNTADAGSNTTIYIYYGDPTVTAPTENPAGVWAASYNAVYHLHDDFLDSTGNDYDATNNGSTDASPAQIADGQDFDGTGDYIQTPTADLQVADDFTISLWFNADATDFAHHLVWQGEALGNGWGTGPAPPNYQQEMNLTLGDIDDFGLDTPDTLSFFLGDTDVGYSTEVISFNTAFADTTDWNHVAVTVSNLATAPTAELFLNGVSVGTDTGTPARTSRGAWDTALRLGRPGLAQRFYDGAMDEVRLSTVARSACWIGGSFSNQDDPGDIGSPGFYTVGASVATLVELVSFEALPGDGAVRLEWETASELDNLGFHVYRALAPHGPWERITRSLIPGLGSSPVGGRYSYLDPGLSNGVTYYYELEDVETTGHTERHGPVAATPFPGGGVGLDPTDEADEPAASDPERGPWVAYGDPEATTLRVVDRGPRHAVLELQTGGFYAVADDDGGVWLSIPGFEDTGEPGSPAVPVRRAWLEAVAGRKVRLTRVVASDVESFGGLRPAVTGERGLYAGRGGILVAGRWRRPAGPRFRGRGLYPERAARVRGTAFQGDAKKAHLELAPLRWDRTRRRLLLARRLRVHVAFAGRERGEWGWGGRFGRRPRPGCGPPRPGGVIARLAVREPGLYAVRFEELFAGRDVRASALSLSRQGGPVAFHVEPAGRVFGPGSALYFVSAGASLNPHGPEAVYELSLAGDGVRMPVQGRPPHGATVPHYWRAEEQEENRLYQPTLLDSETLWYWDYLPSGEQKSYPFPVDALAATGEPARLAVWLHGGSDYPADPDHHLRVSVNGVPVGEGSWDGQTPYVLEADVDPGLLIDGENSLEVENLGDTGAANSLAILDRFALTYPRELVALAGELHGRFGQGGVAEIEGLGGGSFVLDVTDSGPIWLTGARATPRGLAFRSEPGHRYLAVSPEALRQPEVRPAKPSDLRSPLRRADYLLIGPREYLEAGRPLLAQRRRQGLESHAVAIEEVFDEFGHGEGHPEALRSFLGYAYHSWEKAPRYVLLLGDATYDFKGYLQTGIENQVPPYMVKDPYLWTVSDPAYASVNGEDLLPDLALGRLPAQSREQARTLVQKVLAWERAGFDLGGRAVLVADNPDAGGDFVSDANRAADILLAAGREVKKIYLSELGDATRPAIATAFDEGSSLTAYFGHGSVAIWASENLLNTRDVPDLAPQEEQPFLLTVNCLNGYFHLPAGNNALAEELLKAEGKGVVGAFSPSSLGENWAATLYHHALIEELVSGRHERLGDAILAAQAAYAETGARPELLAVYQLLADPALRLR